MLILKICISQLMMICIIYYVVSCFDCTLCDCYKQTLLCKQFDYPSIQIRCWLPSSYTFLPYSKFIDNKLSEYMSLIQAQRFAIQKWRSVSNKNKQRIGVYFTSTSSIQGEKAILFYLRKTE